MTYENGETVYTFLHGLGTNLWKAEIILTFETAYDLGTYYILKITDEQVAPLWQTFECRSGWQICRDPRGPLPFTLNATKKPSPPAGSPSPAPVNLLSLMPSDLGKLGRVDPVFGDVADDGRTGEDPAEGDDEDGTVYVLVGDEDDDGWDEDDDDDQP